MSVATNALIGEMVPDGDDIADIVIAAAIHAMTSSWRVFDNTPTQERLVSEEQVIIGITDAVVEVGIEHTKAVRLCAIARLNAQL